jgi:Transglycosylase-like domain
MTETSRNAAGPRWVAALFGALALAVAIGGAPAGAGVDSVDEAEGRVADLRDDIDAASTEYFAALAAYEQTGADIARLEREIDQADTDAAKLDKVVEERAVEAYTAGGGAEFTIVVDTDGPLETRRAAYLLESANARDNAAIDELVALNAARAAQREELAAAEDAQEAALDVLQEQQRALDAQLAQALSDLDGAVAQAAAARAAAQAAADADVSDDSPAPAPAPTGPPPDYVPTPGEHPQHMHPFLVCTRQIESGGNYQIVSADGLYHGAYQFLPSTWNTTAAYAGRPGLVGVPPETASEYDQDDMAWTLYQWQGSTPWLGRCD